MVARNRLRVSRTSPHCLTKNRFTAASGEASSLTRKIEREGALTEDERKELESYVVIEYQMELVKLEAQRQLRQAS